jgi:uncharacterized protein (DUF2141 family)
MTATGFAILVALAMSQPPAEAAEPGTPVPPAQSQPSAAAPAVEPPAGPAPVTVELVGFRSARGKVRLALYRSKDGFPTDLSKATRVDEAAVTGKRVVVTLEGLEPGIWAIAAYHDENGNGELDTNVVGIPTEGLGVSNDAKGSFGPPKFEGARFELDGTPRRLRITIRYL